MRSRVPLASLSPCFAFFAVTYYDQKASDLISLVRLNPIEAAPAEVQYQNVGRIRNQGWEFEGTARFGALRIAAQYSPMNSTVEKLSPTYTGADFVEGERPPIAPSSTARLSLGYTGTRLGATVGVNRTGTRRAFEFLRLYEALYGTDPDREPFTGNPADYRAEFSPLYRVELAGWWTVNDRLDAFLNVDNLLNDHGKELSDINPVRGRQAVFGLRWSY